MLTVADAAVDVGIFTQNKMVNTTQLPSNLWYKTQ